MSKKVGFTSYKWWSVRIGVVQLKIEVIMTPEVRYLVPFVNK